MKRLAWGLVFTAALLSSGCSASSSASTNSSFVHLDIRTVQVNVVFHDVNVEFNDSDTIHVSVVTNVENASLDNVQPKVKEQGQKLLIASPPFRGSVHPKGRNEVKITLPRNKTLLLHTVSGDCVVTGTLTNAPVSCQVVSGKVHLKVSAPQLQAESVSGEVRVQGQSPNLQVKTTSGNIVLNDLTGSADVQSVSGKVTGLWKSAAASTRIQVKTTSGGVQLSLPSAVSLQGELATLSGRIQSDWPGTKTGMVSSKVQLVGGKTFLQVSSVSGNIALLKRH